MRFVRLGHLVSGFCLFGSLLFAGVDEDSPDEKVEPPHIGNFSLPPSQQPGALFSFGGNIIDEGEVQLFLFADEFVGTHRLALEVFPSVLFGITDNLSILFNFPFAPILRDGNRRSSGLQDFFVQMEYAFYNKSTIDYIDQATVVGSVICPTGSGTKVPPTGFGAPGFFLGGTFYRYYVDWFLITSNGVFMPTSNHGTKFGDQFLYQCGIGRILPSPPGWIYAWEVEFDGQYSRKNRIRGSIDPNSGGNAMFITPSLWASNRDMLIQFGISVPVNQNYFGRQHKFDYVLNFNFAWSFY